MRIEDTKGREVAKKILKDLGFTQFKETKGSTPFDLEASKGKERYLIELKYVEKLESEPLGKSRGTAGFPLPWICRAKAKVLETGSKALVMVIAKRGDRVGYLFLEPRFEEPWFKCELKEGLDYTLPPKNSHKFGKSKRC